MPITCTQCGTAWDPGVTPGVESTPCNCPECGFLTDTTKLQSGGTPPPPDLSSTQSSDLPLAAQTAIQDPANRYGRYIRTSVLGKGGMGEVWKAWDTQLRRWAALKFPLCEDPEDLKRLKIEAQAAAKFSHPNIAAVYEYGQAQGRHFIAMQYVDGQSLEHYETSKRSRYVLCIRLAALALGYAHQNGIIHRDIKPANIMRDRNRNVYVMDFGIAKVAPSSGPNAGASLVTTGMGTGTPLYMSPEQATGQPIDARSDIWSLGVTLYTLMAKHPPFHADSFSDLIQRISSAEPSPLPHLEAGLHAIIFKCLSKNPDGRYPSAFELAKDLARWIKDNSASKRMAPLRHATPHVRKLPRRSSSQIMGFAEPFAVTKNVRQGIQVASLHGRLDTPYEDQLAESLRRSLGRGYTKFVIDCADLDYLSSRGVSAFIAVIDEIRENGGDLKFARVKGPAALVLDRLGISSLMERYDTILEAMKKFNQPAEVETQSSTHEGFVASEEGLVFHTLECSALDGMDKDKIVVFLTQEEAIASGKQPCGMCSDEETEGSSPTSA